MKRKRIRFILILAVLTIVAIGILFINKKIRIASFFANRYKIAGIDVSHYQGTIDWDRLSEQNLNFAYIKATEGSGHVDECFYDNWQKSGETELCIGAYHFFSFDSDGKKQAEFYIDTVGSLSGKMAPMVDVEFYGNKRSNPPPKEEVVEQLGEMLRMLEDHYQIRPVIYTTYKVYDDYIKDSFKEYPLWIRNVYYPPFFKTGNKWTFWQYTDNAVLEGYEGSEKYIDLNVFRGTQDELEGLIVQEEYEETSALSLDEMEVEVVDSGTGNHGTAELP